VFRCLFVERRIGMTLDGVSGEVQLLILGLCDLVPETRALAATRLQLLQARGKPAVPFLARCLRDKDVDVRCNSAAALAEIGPTLDELPGLIEALSDEEWVTRQYAAIAIGKIGPSAKAAALPLSCLLKEEQIWVRMAAGEALQRLGPSAVDAVPALIEGLSDKFTAVYCAKALGKIGPAAKEAVPALKAALLTGCMTWPALESAAELALEEIEGRTAN
jgi:HEAT repeat protein